MLMSGTPSYEQSACKARNLLFASFEARSAGLRMAALNCYLFCDSPIIQFEFLPILWYNIQKFTEKAFEFFSNGLYFR